MQPTPNIALKAKQPAVVRLCTDVRTSDQGIRFRGANDRTPYDLQISDGKRSSRLEREVKPLTTGALYEAKRKGPHGRGRGVE